MKEGYRFSADGGHRLPDGVDICPVCGTSREQIEDTNIACEKARRMAARSHHIMEDDGDELRPRRVRVVDMKEKDDDVRGE